MTLGSKAGNFTVRLITYASATRECSNAAKRSTTRGAEHGARSTEHGAGARSTEAVKPPAALRMLRARRPHESQSPSGSR